MTNTEILSVFDNDIKATITVEIKNDELKFFKVNHRGRIIETGEKSVEGDTFSDSVIDLKSIEINKCPLVSYNKKVFFTLPYEVTSIKQN